MVSVWGTKTRGSSSTVRLEPARPATEPDWPSYRVPRTAGGEALWKSAVRQAVQHGPELPPGPVGLQLALTVGPSRSWTGMWKPSIDGLEPLLGRTYPDRDWNPLDGRIVRLGLHRTTDVGLGRDVTSAVWVRPADERWPEVGWYAAMVPAVRNAYLARHCPPRPTTACQARPASRTPVRRGPTALPDGLSYIATADEFATTKAADEPIVNISAAQPAKLHRHPGRCGFVTVSSFRTKVLVGGGRNGSYVRVVDLDAAAARWPRLTECRNCGDQA